MTATSGYVLAGYGLTVATLGLYALRLVRRAYALGLVRRARGSRWR